jgi:CO/xanthine dehydrogenase FAD-binding subunit
VKPASFRYVAARSLEEALAALADGGDDAKPLAGGQSLVAALNLRLLRPELLVDLGRADLAGIERENGTVRIGAMTRQADLQRSPHVHPLVREALPFVGHVVTRNRGTVGGSIAHADGAAELPLCLVALRGEVVAEGPEGRRTLPAEELFVTHYTTTLRPGELLVETRWPAAGGEDRVAFEELALRAGDFALSMTAVVLRLDGDVVRAARVAVGAVTDRPTVLADVGALVAGNALTDELAREAGALASTLVDPPGGIHASPRYLRRLTGVLVERALRRAR